MGDAFGSFLQGLEAGKAKTRAKKQAEMERLDELMERQREQFNKDRAYKLDINKESRLLTGAAKDQVKRLTDMVTSDNWDPGMADEVLREAQSIQDVYGPVLKYNVAEHFSKALHLDESESMPEGVQGPPDPRRPKKLAGFISEQQKMAYEAKGSELQTERAIGAIINNAADFVYKHGSTDGVLDRKKVPEALLQYKLMVQNTEGMDQKVVDTAFDNLMGDLDKALEGIYAGQMTPEQERIRLETTAKGVTSYVKTALGMDAGFGSGLSLTAGQQAAFNKINDAGQQYARMGYTLPVIEMMLADQFIDDDNMWLTGAKANNRDRVLADAPIGFQARVQEVLNKINPDTGEPYIDPLLVRVDYDKETGEGTILWNTYDERHGLDVAGGPVFRDVLPLAPTEMPAQPERQQGPTETGQTPSQAPAPSGQQRVGGLFGQGGVFAEQGVIEQFVARTLKTGTKEALERDYGIEFGKDTIRNRAAMNQIRRDAAAVGAGADVVKWLADAIFGKKQRLGGADDSVLVRRNR